MVAFLARALTTELWKCEVVWNLNPGGGLGISLGAALMHNTPVWRARPPVWDESDREEEEVNKWTSELARELVDAAFWLEYQCTVYPEMHALCGYWPLY